MTWGAYRGSDSSAVQDELRNVLQVQATDGAFAAIRGQGFKLVSNYLILQPSVLAGCWPVSGSQLKILKPRRWKCCDLGQCKMWRRQQRSPRSSSKCPAGAVDRRCFRCDLERWDSCYMGRLGFVELMVNPPELGHILFFFLRFLATKSPKAIQGDPMCGGESSAVQGRLQSVKLIQATRHAFSAICADGTVVTWGDQTSGGDSSLVQHQLRDVQQIKSTDTAFAAILGSGNAVAWGDPDSGGDSREVQDHLKNVRQLHSTTGAFAAILADGSVVTWGDESFGGDSRAVQHQLRHVRKVHSTDAAFAALLGDGSLVTWGDPRYGGDSSGIEELQVL